MRKIRECKYCGSVKEVRRNVCGKHRFQIRIYGKVLKVTIHDRNTIEELENNVILLHLRNIKKKIIAKTILNKEDYEKIKHIKFHLNENGYAIGKCNGKNKRLHRIIMGEKLGFDIDHINRNRLDNRKENLRFVTRSQNNFNRAGIRGITRKKNGTWHARITINRKIILLGTHKTKELAEARRVLAEKEFHHLIWGKPILEAK